MFNDFVNSTKGSELSSFQGYLVANYGVYTWEILSAPSSTIILRLFKHLHCSALVWYFLCFKHRHGTIYNIPSPFLFLPCPCSSFLAALISALTLTSSASVPTQQESDFCCVSPYSLAVYSMHFNWKVPIFSFKIPVLSILIYT